MRSAISNITGCSQRSCVCENACASPASNVLKAFLQTPHLCQDMQCLAPCYQTSVVAVEVSQRTCEVEHTCDLDSTSDRGLTRALVLVFLLRTLSRVELLSLVACGSHAASLLFSVWLSSWALAVKQKDESQYINELAQTGLATTGEGFYGASARLVSKTKGAAQPLALARQHLTQAKASAMPGDCVRILESKVQ